MTQPTIERIELRVLDPGKDVRWTERAGACHLSTTLIEITDDALAESTESCRNRFNAAFLELLVSRLEEANIRVSQLLMERNIAVH